MEVKINLFQSINEHNKEVRDIMIRIRMIMKMRMMFKAYKKDNHYLLRKDLNFFQTIVG